jgi:hypothetical protein
MSNAKDEAEKILDAMPVAMQEQAIKALIAVFESQSPRELETLQKTLPVEIKKFIALMGLASFQEREMESKKRKSID